MNLLFCERRCISTPLTVFFRGALVRETHLLRYDVRFFLCDGRPDLALVWLRQACATVGDAPGQAPLQAGGGGAGTSGSGGGGTAGTATSSATLILGSAKKAPTGSASTPFAGRVPNDFVWSCKIVVVPEASGMWCLKYGWWRRRRGGGSTHF